MKFLNGFAFGGTEKQAAFVARELDRTRFELHVGCLKALGHLTGEFRALAASFGEYRVRHFYDHTGMTQLFRLAKDMRRRRFDVVHTYGFYGNVFAIPAARLARVPVVIASIRDMGNVWTARQRRVQRFACRFADCILTNANAVKEQLIRDGYDATKIEVIGNGIAIPPSSPTSSLREELGLAPETPLVAALSVLRREKGIEYFLDAAKIVSRRSNNVRFLIVGDSVYQPPGSSEVIGDSSYREELQQRARDLAIEDRVIFTGLRHDAASVLSQVTISVLPTLTEALSNTILESMAAGTPVIATNVGGNPEAVKADVSGLLVPPRNAAALADAICNLLANPERAQQMGDAGRQIVRDRFSVDAMVRATEALYLNLLSAKAAA